MSEQTEFEGAEQRIDWSAWRQEIRAIGQTNPLLYFEANPFSQIDLERAHPGGMAQFVSSGSGTLSNLVRDPLAFSRAFAAAKRIKAKAQKLEATAGIHTVFLAGGVVSLNAGGEELAMPLLLWPLEMTARGNDFEVRITASPRVNPALVHELSQRFAVRLDTGGILAAVAQSDDLLPIAALDLVAQVELSVPVSTGRTLVIANFAPAAVELDAALVERETSVLKTLASRNDLAEPAQLPAIPAIEPFLIADADSVQQRIVSRAMAGQSFAVETLPGCGYLQTAVNALAALAKQGKRVLVVAPRRTTLYEIVDRFADLGLQGLAIREDQTWMDAIGAISRNEKSQPAAIDGALERRRQAEAGIEDYFEALNAKSPELGFSISDVLLKLAELSAMPKAPQSKARIDQGHLLEHADRSRALELLTEAQALGEFDFGPQDTAWYQAEFANADEVSNILTLSKRLHEETFPRLANLMRDYIAKVEFKNAGTVEDWGAYLRLLTGIRDILERFKPEVFERNLDDLIAATAPRTSKSAMPGSSRRRLKKLAKELQRPGAHIADLNAMLTAASEYRQAWQKSCLSTKQPHVPSGIGDVLVAYQSFHVDLERIQRHLDRQSTEPVLAKLSIADLATKLKSLAEDTAALANLEDRANVTGQLRALGLGSVVRDFGRLHLKREQIAAEFELIWWQSALEYLIAADGRVLRYSSEQVSRLEADFAAADSALVQAGAPALAAELATRWHDVLEAHPTEKQILRTVLKADRKVTSRALAEAAGPVWRELSPIVLSSPFEVHNAIAAGESFDSVFVMDAAGTSVAENLVALTSAEQVVAWGDDAIAAATGFEIEPQESPVSAPESRSIYQEMRDRFGVETLAVNWRQGGQALGQFVNREFYQNRMVIWPTAADFNGDSSVTIDVLEQGNRAPDATDGSNESLDAEVMRTVGLVIEHARNTPHHSLLVATASELHAERIRENINKTIGMRNDLGTFFEAHGREAFAVVTIAELQHRTAQRVIFSIGFGRTNHGSVLSNFGQLSEPHGRRYLANLLVSARSQITVVSCFGPQDIPTDRLTHGAVLLRELLQAGSASWNADEESSSPMLRDLAGRIRKFGARVKLNLGDRLPMSIGYANTAGVVFDDASLHGSSLTEKLRLYPALLKANGWSYLRVHSFEMFADPQALAVRIGDALGMQVTKRPVPLFDVPHSDDQPKSPRDVESSNDRRLREDKPPHWA
jgi:hypothetical protein